MLDGTGSSDVDSADTLTYEWDLDGDSVTDFTGATPTVPWMFIANAGLGAGTHANQIRLTVTDDGTPVMDHTVSTTLTIQDEFHFSPASDGTADDYTLKVVGNELHVIDTNTTAVLSKVMRTGINAIVITGSSDRDTFTVDFSGDNPIPTGGLSVTGLTGLHFNGNGPTTAPGDKLILTDGTSVAFFSVTHTFTNAHGGQIELDENGTVSSITYTGLEPIEDYLPADTRTFKFNDNSNTITLADDDNPANDLSQISSTGSSETVTFRNPTQLLTVDADATNSGGNDRVTLNVLDGNFAANVTVNGLAGNDTLDASSLTTGVTVLTLNGGLGTDTLRGSAGNDILIDSDVGFNQITGGDGFDRFLLETAGATLDLSTISNTKFQTVELVDIDGTAPDPDPDADPNNLILDLSEVIAATDTSNTLIVLGGADDNVTMGTGWTFTGRETFEGTVLNVFDQAPATLKVALGLPPMNGVIEGTKWNDLDRDGVEDAGEAGLAGWTIYLDLNNNGALDAGEPSDVTDATGAYRIDGLPPGSYSVAEVLQSGWIQTAPSSDLAQAVQSLKDNQAVGSTVIDGLDQVSGLALSPDGRFVYAAGKLDDSLAVFSRNGTSGRLTFVEVVKDGVGGVDGLDGVTSVTVSPDGKYVYAASVIDDAVAVFSRNATTGQLTFVETLKDGVNGVDGLNGATSVTMSADGNHVYLTGQIDDAVAVFSRNANTGRLTFVEALKDGFGGADGLDGAMDVRVSPDGAHVYVASRDEDSVTVFTRNAATGQLTLSQVLRDDSNGGAGLNGASSVSVSPDGAHVYVAGLNDDAVTVFTRNATTGQLTFSQLVKDDTDDVDGLNGATSVTVSPDGSQVYVAGLIDDAFVAFNRDATTGQLTFSQVMKDGVGGADGLDGANYVLASPDDLHIYVSGSWDDAVVTLRRDAGTYLVDLAAGQTVRNIDFGNSSQLNTVGLYNPDASGFYLKNSHSGGVADEVFDYGPAGSSWVALSGDWDGNGGNTVGLYNGMASEFYLKNSLSGGVADVVFGYGPAGSNWTPVVGDWDGDGVDTLGLYNPVTSDFYLKNSHSGGVADVVFGYGPAGSNWTPVVGDWDGDGIDTLGLYNSVTSEFYLKNSHSGGVADVVFGYGPAGSNWTPVVGDWDGDGVDTLGLYNPVTSEFYLKNSLSGGDADIVFGYGPADAGWTPLTGDWTVSSAIQLDVAPLASPVTDASLTQGELAPIVETAIGLWSDAGVSASDLSVLEDVQITISDLSGLYLALTSSRGIVLDVNAAGYGWYVDGTPLENEEYDRFDGSEDLQGVGEAADRVDLLTVLAHEFGHVLGLSHDFGDDVMEGLLPVGVRRLPGLEEIDAAFASGWNDFLAE